MAGKVGNRLSGSDLVDRVDPATADLAACLYESGGSLDGMNRMDGMRGEREFDNRREGGCRLFRFLLFRFNPQIAQIGECPEATEVSVGDQGLRRPLKSPQATKDCADWTVLGGDG